MKKLYLRIISAILFVSILFISSCSENDLELNLDPDSPFTSATAISPVGNVREEVRGVWIASVYNINFPSAPDMSEDDLKAELHDIVDTVLLHNMNTVFFQVHPASDALYKSKIFPVSEYLYTDGVLHFDPLEYMSRLCRENGISLFAWMNPLRVSVNAADTHAEAKENLPSGSPGLDDEMCVFYGDGKLYLNCGNDDVIALVSDAVDEIMSGYDVDGIVFDDYFYPYPATDSTGVVCEFDDSTFYNASDKTMPVEDWRRNNVNRLVERCYNTVKSYGDDKKFGVAPFGIWQNSDGINGGSATSGMEAYNDLYCDASAWIKGKYVDFISPQLYWKCSDAAAPFGELVRFWDSLTSGTGVELVISHGLYRYDNDWESPAGELPLQIDIARDHISYRGSMLYGYEALKKDAAGASGDTSDAFADLIYYYSPSDLPDDIVFSSLSDTALNGHSVIFSGISNPEYPLVVNGKNVTRKQGGYFELVLTLKDGENIFTFTCGDTSSKVRIIK